MKKKTPRAKTKSVEIASPLLVCPEFTSAELDKLATDINAGKVFASWQINGMDQESATRVFAPLAIVGNLLRPTNDVNGQPNDLVHVCQYNSKSLRTNLPTPYPIFNRCIGIRRKFVLPLTRALKAIAK